ncbi:MAG: asparagine synthase-related protein [Thermoplasmata archaeon]|nr:asparagine synthase-related protein [Thermoplasmata archaeon]
MSTYRAPVPTGAEATDAAPARLSSLIQRAVHRLVDATPNLSLLYSGGLDSSTVATAAAASAPLLVAIGTRESRDLESARSGAHLLGLRLLTRVVEEADVRSAMVRWATEIAGVREPQRSVLIATGLALEAAPGPRVLCGQGADELFHGYAHFENLAPNDAGIRAAADFEQLRVVDWPRARRLAQRLGRELVSPFFDTELVEWVQTLPAQVHRAPDGRKPLLRAAAALLGVPRELIARPKRALQYGSGVYRMVRRADRDAAADPSVTTA